MKFDRPVRMTYKSITPEDFFDGKCPFCRSLKLSKRSSRIREVPDLGPPSEKVIVQLDVVNFVCQKCTRDFTPEHPFYPPKYEYSLDIIEYALTRFHYQNVSGKTIARDLRLLHNVQISEATIYSRLKTHSPEFLKAKLAKDPTRVPNHIQVLTVDGSRQPRARDHWKKKHGESFSVTKLKDGRYLLMWWE